MADDPLDTLRLSLMQDVLPVGMAIVDRARKGGANKVVEAFSTEEDPFQFLKSEGEVAAKSVREKLDQVSPGLGNPVVSVKVDVDPGSNLSSEEIFHDECDDKELLLQHLSRIQKRLTELDDYLTTNSVNHLDF